MIDDERLDDTKLIMSHVPDLPSPDITLRPSAFERGDWIVLALKRWGQGEHLIAVVADVGEKQVRVQYGPGTNLDFDPVNGQNAVVVHKSVELEHLVQVATCGHSNIARAARRALLQRRTAEKSKLRRLMLHNDDRIREIAIRLMGRREDE